MSHRYALAGPRHAVIHHMGLLIAGLFMLLIVVALLAVTVGAVPIRPATVWAVIADRLAPGGTDRVSPAGLAAIVWDVRLPRTVLGATVGAGLALVGAALQAVTRNPLADPHLLGISSGASCGAILALIVTGMLAGPATVPLFAFAGALLATGIVLAVTRFTGSTDAGRLILAGVAVSFVLAALGNFVIFLGDPRAAPTAIFWMLGGLGLARWDHLAWPLGALIVGGGLLIGQARAFNAMTLGDETATTLGVPARPFRLAVFFVCALLTGAMVAFSGVIGFVGLMVPHIARLIVGGDYRRVLPVSALLGAVFLVASDIVARTLVAPRDMPIGIVTGLVGGGFFILLLRRRPGDS